MGIGVSVFLLAVGAVLAFAVTDNLNQVDLTAVGYIVMVAGIIGLFWSLYLTSRTTRGVSTLGGVRDERVVREPDLVRVREERVVRDRDVY